MGLRGRAPPRAIGLEAEAVECTVDYGYGTRHKFRCVADEVVYRAAQLIGGTEPTERRVCHNGVAAGGEAAVGVGEQRAVLLGEEEAGGDGVHANTFAELRGHLYGHVLGKLLYGGLGRGVAHNAGEGAEGRFGTEIDDDAISSLGHVFGKYLGGNYRAVKVEVDYLLEVVGRHVKEGLVDGNRCSRHVSAGSVDEDIDAAVAVQYFVAALFERGAVEYVASQEEGLTSRIGNFFGESFAVFAVTPHDNHDGSFAGQIFGDATA